MEELKAAKIATEEVDAKEKQSNEENMQALGEARKIILSLEYSKKNLEAQVDSHEAQVKKAEDNLDKEQAGLKNKIVDAEDKFTDMAWYRIWMMNPDLDLSFLEGELEITLATWRTCLEDQEELMTFSEAAAKGDLDGDVSSKTAKSIATLEAEVDVLIVEDGTTMDTMTPATTDQAETASKIAHIEIVKLVKETLAKAASSVEDALPQS